MNRAHKIRLNPNPEQEQYLWRCAGVARFTWNWALAEYNNALSRGERPRIVGKGSTLKSEFVRRKNEEGFAPFVGEVQSYAYQYAFDDLQTAVSRYHKLRKAGMLKPPPGWKPRKDGKPFGWPVFKSRDKVTPAFGIANTAFNVNGHLVRISKCPSGPINMAEVLRFEGKIMSGRVSHSGGHWYMSIQVEMPDPEPTADPSSVVGIDMGIRYRAVTSDGVIYDNPKALAQNLRKLRRLQRSFSRMQKGGANRKKRQREIAKLHARIGNIRREHAHEMTTELVSEYGLIGVEDLNLRGMVKNRRLARAVSDAGMYQVRTQLDYKLLTSGGRLVVVDRWYASSKICSECGAKVKELPLSVRAWACPECGTEHERDGNAAKNIRDEALRLAGAA